MTAARLATVAARSIFRNRMRSLLTSLGIIIGVCSVIVMVAVGQGSQEQIARRISAMGTNLIMVMPPRGRQAANRLSTADVKMLRSEATLVSAISGTVRRGGTQVFGGSGSWPTTVWGVEPDYLTIKQWKVERGDSFTEADLAGRSKVAVLGTTVAAKLFDGADPVGSQVRIGTTPFTVIGVLESKGSGGMGNDQDDLVMVPLDTAVTRLQKNRFISSIEVSAARADLMDRAQAEVEQILRESHRISGDDTSDFDVMNQAEIIKTASQTSQTLTTLLAAIAGVSLVVGGIGIMNIMLVSVTERTREIGIRMAVGARKRDILMQFLAEAFILSMFGGIAGILIALAAVAVLNGLAGVPAVIPPSIIALAAGFAAAVGIFFGYTPARKAANLYPIDALRSE